MASSLDLRRRWDTVLFLRNWRYFFRFHMGMRRLSPIGGSIVAVSEGGCLGGRVSSASPGLNPGRTFVRD